MASILEATSAGRDQVLRREDLLEALPRRARRLHVQAGLERGERGTAGQLREGSRGSFDHHVGLRGPVGPHDLAVADLQPELLAVEVEADAEVDPARGDRVEQGGEAAVHDVAGLDRAITGLAQEGVSELMHLAGDDDPLDVSAMEAVWMSLVDSLVNWWLVHPGESAQAMTDRSTRLILALYAPGVAQSPA